MTQSTEIPIPHFKDNLSTYSKFLSLYTRDNDYHVLSIEDKQNSKFSTNWESFVSKLKPANGYTNKFGVTEYFLVPEDAEYFTGMSNLPIKISEMTLDNEVNQVRGVITTVENENEFNDWFIAHVLTKSQLHLSNNTVIDKDDGFATKFADYFAENLKADHSADQWIVGGGKDYFISRVKYFTSRNLKIEAILPAFPCKSSNTEKVHGAFPDKGEELALRRLIQATLDVKEFYEPGMKIWIVSDGHVFSDCIGVDDDVVDNYTAKLHALYQKLAIPGVDAIGFCGLKDLFFQGGAPLDPEYVAEWNLEHWTGSKICDDSELSRKVLMKGCDTDNGRLREQIKIPDHPRLNLYRGFSRFMMEDLKLNAYCQTLSGKAFKKVISKVAFEMIKRNDAYSNLVELIFPFYVRLSIHAHNNQGPKFGIKVVSPQQATTIRSLDSAEEPTFEDLLHIPTPWHNCVVYVENNGKHYLTKTRVVEDAIAAGYYTGSWVPSDMSTGKMGYYQVVKVPSGSNSPEAVATLVSEKADTFDQVTETVKELRI